MYNPRFVGVVVATSVETAIAALSSPGAVAVAGGTDLVVELNEHRRVSPRTVVAVDRIPELREWRHDPATGSLRLGAAVTWSEIETAPIADWVPALAQAARTVGSPQIRHAGTIGGNLATASPAGDGLPVLAALDAVVHLAGPSGGRDLRFDEFMVGPKRTARLEGELITGVTMPVTGEWQGYRKVGVRNAMVISTASAALAVVAGEVRLALGSVGPVIIRCRAAEAFLAGQTLEGPPSDQVIREFASVAAGEARPIDDHRSTAAYRRHAVEVLARRLLRSAYA